MKKSHIENRQIVFEKLTLRDFKMKSSKALKTSKKYSLIMSNYRVIIKT